MRAPKYPVGFGIDRKPFVIRNDCRDETSVPDVPMLRLRKKTCDEDCDWTEGERAIMLPTNNITKKVNARLELSTGTVYQKYYNANTPNFH